MPPGYGVPNPDPHQRPGACPEGRFRDGETFRFSIVTEPLNRERITNSTDTAKGSSWCIILEICSGDSPRLVLRRPGKLRGLNERGAQTLWGRAGFRGGRATEVRCSPTQPRLSFTQSARMGHMGNTG
jgi:hypothetical protein